jgi:hypothetical protein
MAAMKMPQADYEALKRDIQQYAKGRIGFGSRGIRDYWDAFFGVMTVRSEADPMTGITYVYDVLGLNDDHIETALRRIMHS